MNKIVKKTLWVNLLVLLVAISIGCVGCSSYTVEDVIGNYSATGEAYSANEYIDYDLTITSTQGKCTRTYNNRGSSRAGIVGSSGSSQTVMFSGEVKVEGSTIYIGSTKGKISTKDGRIVITIGGKEYRKR